MKHSNCRDEERQESKNRPFMISSLKKNLPFNKIKSINKSVLQVNGKDVPPLFLHLGWLSIALESGVLTLFHSNWINER